MNTNIMKTILLLLVVIGLASASPMMRMPEPEMVDETTPFGEFMLGFLEGLKVQGETKKILECVKGGEDIIAKITEAVNYLKNIDISHIDELIKGIQMLISAASDIYNLIKPCTSGFEELQKLFEAIKNFDIYQIAWKLIANAFAFYADIQGAIEAFSNSNFAAAGKNVGDILYKLFLESAQASNMVYDFIKGLFEGLNEKGNVSKVLECLKNAEPIITDIMRAIDMISYFTYKNITEGVMLLVSAVTKLIQILTPCTEGFTQLEKLLDALANVDIMKLVTRIMMNPSAFIKDITDCIASFNSGDYEGCGKSLGDILFRLFLDALMQDQAFADFVNFMAGFFDGIGNGQNFTDIESCLNKMPEVWNMILAAINQLQNISWKSLDKLVEALIQIFNAFITIFQGIKPCSKVPGEIEEMIQKLINVDYTQLMQKILLNSFQIISDITTCIKYMQSGNYTLAGKNLGDIFYLLVFKD